MTLVAPDIPHTNHPKAILGWIIAHTLYANITLSEVARNHIGAFNLSFSLESWGNLSNILKHQKKIIINTKKEMVKATARMSSRTLKSATTVLRVRNPAARLNGPLRSELRFTSMSTECDTIGQLQDIWEDGHSRRQCVKRGIVWLGGTARSGLDKGSKKFRGSFAFTILSGCHSFLG